MPDDSVSVTEPPELLQVLLLRLMSNPDGAVAVTFATRCAPDTLKLVDEDAVPDVVLSAEGVPVVDISGCAETVLEGIATFTVTALVLVNTTLPE